MKTKLLLIALLSVFLNACEKQQAQPILTNEPIAIYQLKSFEKVANSLEIVESTIVLNDTPLVSYKDIISYSQLSNTFILSEKSRKAIQNLEQSGIRTAFAVKAGGTVVYTGYFWSSILSSNCDWTVIDVFKLPKSNDLHVQLGYPSDLYRGTITDRRGDSRILDILRKDNKLTP
jgi:hypothetical protein